MRVTILFGVLVFVALQGAVTLITLPMVINTVRFSWGCDRWAKRTKYTGTCEGIRWGLTDVSGSLLWVRYDQGQRVEWKLYRAFPSTP